MVAANVAWWLRPRKRRLGVGGWRLLHACWLDWLFPMDCAFGFHVGVAWQAFSGAAQSTAVRSRKRGSFFPQCVGERVVLRKVLGAFSQIDRVESFLAPASACSCGRGLLTQVVHFLQRAWVIFPQRPGERPLGQGARVRRVRFCSLACVFWHSNCGFSRRASALFLRKASEHGVFPQKSLRTWCFSPRKASERGATSTLLARRVFGPKLSDVAHWVVPGI